MKGFTNDDDIRSKLIYETVSRTNDAKYFRFLAGINEKMSTVDAILQYSKEPYSYLLHKNRRLLSKTLKLHNQKEQNKISVSVPMEKERIYYKMQKTSSSNLLKRFNNNQFS